MAKSECVVSRQTKSPSKNYPYRAAIYTNAPMGKLFKPMCDYTIITNDGEQITVLRNTDEILFDEQNVSIKKNEYRNGRPTGRSEIRYINYDEIRYIIYRWPDSVSEFL